MACVILLLATLTATSGHTAAVGLDDTPDCPATGNLEDVHQFCHYTGQEVQVLFADPGVGVRYRVEPMCVETQQVQASCINQQTCASPPDTWKYYVLRSDAGGPYQPWGTVCLAANEADQLGAITPARVLEEMRKLTWPDAVLLIQPPGGKTLVNLPTNFHTTTTGPTSQAITLLGHQVTIEADPIGYTWHFGDGSTHTGPDPGAAYPDLRITHTYTTPGQTLTPSVEVTYRGRYHVDQGPWIPVPETLTVPGSPTSLTVHTATPHLVG